MGNSRLDQWIEDIDQLAIELPQRHKNLFFQLKKKDFQIQIQKLKNNLENYDNYTIVAHIAAIVASVRDAHTMVVLPITRHIPLEFYWFHEGVFIIGENLKKAEFINCKVTHLNGIPINEVIERVGAIISYENDSFFKAQLPQYLTAIEMLYGLEIVDTLDEVGLTLKRPSGEIVEVAVKTCEYKPLKTKAIKDTHILEEDLPLYRRNKEKSYWSLLIEERDILYVNYNRCKDMQDISVEKFYSELTQFFTQKDIKKLVIDLRNNLGGDSRLFEPFIRELRKNNKLNQEGGIFVILGRDTFSSALLNAYSLKNKTKAIFVGEATGGKPNCYGEVEYFDLNNSKLKIRYSTAYYKIVKGDNALSFLPDVPFEVTHKDYIENKDPCMEYILNLD